MAEYEKKVRAVLEENGCVFVRRGKGDHDIWHSPITNKNFPVDTKIILFSSKNFKYFNA